MRPLAGDFEPHSGILECIPTRRSSFCRASGPLPCPQIHVPILPGWTSWVMLLARRPVTRPRRWPRWAGLGFEFQSITLLEAIGKRSGMSGSQGQGHIVYVDDCEIDLKEPLFAAVLAFLLPVQAISTKDDVIRPTYLRSASSVFFSLVYLLVKVVWYMPPGIQTSIESIPSPTVRWPACFSGCSSRLDSSQRRNSSRNGLRQ